MGSARTTLQGGSRARFVSLNQQGQGPVLVDWTAPSRPLPIGWAPSTETVPCPGTFQRQHSMGWLGPSCDGCGGVRPWAASQGAHLQVARNQRILMNSDSLQPPYDTNFGTELELGPFFHVVQELQQRSIAVCDRPSNVLHRKIPLDLCLGLYARQRVI